MNNTKIKLILGKQVKRLVELGVNEKDAKIIVSEIYSSIVDVLKEEA